MYVRACQGAAPGYMAEFTCHDSAHLYNSALTVKFSPFSPSAFTSTLALEDEGPEKGENAGQSDCHPFPIVMFIDVEEHEGPFVLCTETFALASRTHEQLTNQPTNQPANQHTKQPTLQPTNQPTNHQPTNQSTN